MDSSQRVRAILSFVQAADAGSFAGGARALGISSAAVSKNVAGLEKSLGVRLMNRTTRTLSLTDEGAAFLRQARIALQALDAATDVIVAHRAAPTGRVRISTSVGFGRDQLGLDAAQFGVAVEHVVDRRLRQPGRLLRDVGDDPARRHVQVALVGVELVAQHGEQAGLAAAVGAGEADLPAGMDLQRGTLDEDLGAAREAQIAKTDHERIHGHGAAD
jgi:DNA-binding transcriptional LysR family regulator